MSDAHVNRAHALLSPSSASRWLNCPPSARLEEKEPQSNSKNSYAEEGTKAHELAELELHLALGIVGFDEYKEKFREISASEYYSDNMSEEVDKYVTYVLEIIEEVKARTEDPIILIEEKVDLTHFVPEGFGSNDSIIIADGIMYVNDLKYGKGVKVSAKENSQLKLYALGSLIKYNLMYGIDRVILSIIQPRLNHIDRFEIDHGDLIHWGENIVRPGASLAFEGKGLQKAGEHCRFCKVSAKCKTLAKHNLELAKHEFKDPNLLTDGELVEILERAEMLNTWVNSVSDYILKSALSGKEIKGYKLVEGRANRKITSEEAVIEELSYSMDESFFMNKKLKGISELEKLLGKKQFTEIVGPYLTKPVGKPTLVTEDDPRPRFELNSAKNDFND